MYAPTPWYIEVLNYVLAISQMLFNLTVPIFLMLIWLNLRKRNRVVLDASSVAAETGEAVKAVKKPARAKKTKTEAKEAE